MRFHSLEQGSPEWETWRRKGIGASDAGVLLRTSPYNTPLGLWKEKTSRADPEESTFAMRRGNRLEPVARELYIKETGIQADPVCVSHDEYPWLLASLDGLSPWGEVVQEIKCPKITYHLWALEDQEFPDYYMAQMQQQLLITGASMAHYISYSEHSDMDISERLVIIEVEPNLEMQREILERAKYFWSCVQEDREPTDLLPDHYRVTTGLPA